MFRCTICQKLYNNKVPYCECGNDEFELLQDTEPEATQAKNTIDNLSVGIFSLCIILSLIIWFLPVKTHHKTAPTVEQTTVSQNIPTNIDKIWNDTPAYSSKSESGTPIELYKKSLENMLNSNLTPKTYNGDGNCRIEFTVADNGKLIKKLLDPEFEHPRTYLAQVDGQITEEAIRQLQKGVTIKGYRTKPCKAEIATEPDWLWPRNPPVRFRANIPTSWVQLTLIEGKNRQVRHMTAAVGFPTLRLIRVKIGNITLGDLQPGQWRQITTPILG